MAQNEPPPQAEKRSAKKTSKVFKAENLEHLFANLSEETKKTWRELYNENEEFLKREAMKAFLYYTEQNSKKEPKTLQGWSKALGSWYERGWGYQVKKISSKNQNRSFSNQQSLNSDDEINKLLSEVKK